MEVSLNTVYTQKHTNPRFLKTTQHPKLEHIAGIFPARLEWEIQENQKRTTEKGEKKEES